MSITKVNSKEWIPVGNYIMVKPVELDDTGNEFLLEQSKDKSAFEVLGFGSSFDAKGLAELISIGDKVIIIDNANEKTGIVVKMIGEGDIYFYPPRSVAAVINKENIVTAIGDYVLIQRDETETSIGNILLPSVATSQSTEAVVKYIGTGKNSDNEDTESFVIKPGDKVLISKWNKNDIKINGESFVILKQSEILAKHA